MVKDVDVQLPPYQKQLVLECYLERGEKYRAFLSESESYFDNPQINEINDANVLIQKNGFPFELKNQSIHDQKFNKYYNYQSSHKVNATVEDTFKIEVKDNFGRVITATTSFLPVVPIDCLAFRYKSDDNISMRMFFKDNPDEKNYYRFTVHKGEISKNLKQDFVFSDDIFDSEQTALGTGYDFKKGDTVVVTLYHLEKKYFDFIESAEKAKNANYNPFAQPTSIKSAVDGGIGVFTALSYDRVQEILKQLV